MKISIKKLPHGDVRVELTHDTAQKPIVINLDKAKLTALLAVLDAGNRAEKFEFILEL